MELNSTFKEEFSNSKMTLGLFLRPNEKPETNKKKKLPKKPKEISQIESIGDFRNVDSFHRGKMFCRELWSENYYVRVMQLANFQKMDFRIKQANRE